MNRFTFAAMATSILVTASAFAGFQDFIIANDTASGILSVYTSPVEVEDWEEDILGDAMIAPGKRLKVRINGRSERFWDVKVVYSGRKPDAVFAGVDLGTVSALVLTDNPRGGTTMTPVSANGPKNGPKRPDAIVGGGANCGGPLGGSGFGTTFGSWTPPAAPAFGGSDFWTSFGSWTPATASAQASPSSGTLTAFGLDSLDRQVRDPSVSPSQFFQNLSATGLFNPLLNAMNMPCMPGASDEMLKTQMMIQFLFGTHSPGDSVKEAENDAKAQDLRAEEHVRKLARIEGVTSEQYVTGRDIGIVSWTGRQNGSEIGRTLDGNIYKVDQDGTAYRLDNGNWYRQ